MKIIIDFPDTLIGRVRRVVQTGGYEDARDFVTTAIENQLQLEESVDTAYQTLDEAITKHDSGDRSYGPSPADTGEPITDGLGRHEYGDVPTVETPDRDRLDDGPLWGQYNRLFPVKLLVRRLANVLHEHREDGMTSSRVEVRRIDITRFCDETAKLAREYGLVIKRRDEEASRKRGEKLSTGLPIGDDARKSLNRFTTHFVGDSDRNGNLGGAPAHLHFVDISDEEVGRIGITETGLRFAELYNPLLDDGPDANVSLSRDEREFYLQHVRDELPDEYGAMVAVAQAITGGNDRPTSLTERVAELNSDWSDNQATTMRSGLVARMHELGLVERERVGQRGIAYRLTAGGEDFFSNTRMVSET